MKPTRSKIPLRQWLLGIFGVILALLAIGSVSITAHNNHRQQKLIACGAQAVEQTVTGLQARDAAAINSTKTTIVVTDIREQVILALADVAEDKPGAQTELTQALQKYKAAIDTYRDALSASISAQMAYPLPSASCLQTALEHQQH